MTTPYPDIYLEPFIKATYAKAFRYAYSMVSSRPAATFAAQDITQTAYERLLIKLKHDPSMPKRLGREAMVTYLLSIVRYLGFELARDSRHFKEIDAMRALQEGGQEIEDLADIANVETFVLANDATSHLFGRISRDLPEQQRKIIALKLEDCSHEEIAARLCITVGAVKTALHRARRRLHIWVKEDDQPETVLCQQEVNSSDSEERALLLSIKKLPDPYRAVVALRLVQGMNCEEIAQLLQRNVGTVKSQVSRGKQMLANPQQGPAEKKSAKAKVVAELQATLAYKDQLPDHLRQVVELYCLQSLSCNAIARKLGKPESTIKGWIRQARKYLQNCTASTCPERSARTSRRHELPSRKHYDLLDRVPSSYRYEMKLYYEQSLSIADIAKQLNLSQSAIKMRLTHGRAQLDDIYARVTGEEAV